MGAVLLPCIIIGRIVQLQQSLTSQCMLQMHQYHSADALEQQDDNMLTPHRTHDTAKDSMHAGTATQVERPDSDSQVVHSFTILFFLLSIC